MARKSTEKDAIAILAVLQRYPAGASIGDLMNTELQLARRTLHRRLAKLELLGKVRIEGVLKGTKYHLVSPGPTSTSPIEESSALTSPLQMSTKQIAETIRQDISKRIPVGYNRSFLVQYVPNQTSYLSPEEIQAMGSMGTVGMDDLPAGTYLRKVMDRLLVDLSWNSSRLEGNTYSLLETRRLLDQGEGATGKAAEETQMILNHKAAIELLAEEPQDIGFNRYTICNLHALLSDNLLPDPNAMGRPRERDVSISGSVYYPLAVPQQIDELFDIVLQKAGAITDPFEQAFFTLVHLPYLQPFEDVNKRVSRLAANIPMIQHNLCPLSFVDVARDTYVEALLGVYELNQVQYLKEQFLHAYERSCARYKAIRQSLGEPDPFRLKYREAIGRCVRHVVSNGMHRQAALRWISINTPFTNDHEDQQLFIDIVITELDSLHIGNIARYRLRPTQFDNWSTAWNKREA
jgi:hypothetical protein